MTKKLEGPDLAPRASRRPNLTPANIIAGRDAFPRTPPLPRGKYFAPAGSTLDDEIQLFARKGYRVRWRTEDAAEMHRPGGMHDFWLLEILFSLTYVRRDPHTIQFTRVGERIRRDGLGWSEQPENGKRAFALWLVAATAIVLIVMLLR